MSNSSAALDHSKLSPMLLQYLEYKRSYPDCLLLFQVGDFFELFFDDAVQAARALNLTLTSRDKTSPDPIPMAGVPLAVVDSYVERLVAQGFSVALVSQAEPAGQGKGMVARKLERIITPGIRILSNAESGNSDAIVAAAYIGSENDTAVAFSDVQSGRVYVREGVELRTLTQEIGRISPAEIILPRAVDGQTIDRRLHWVRELENLQQGRGLKFRSDGSVLETSTGSRELPAIKGYAALSASARKAVRLLLAYVDETTVSSTVPIAEILLKDYDKVVGIDATTRANLELLRNLKDGTSRGTLFEVLDSTSSIGGARALKQWLVGPLTDIGQIVERQDVVEQLRKDEGCRSQMQSLLKGITDLERVCARLELGIASPRELGALRDVLLATPKLRDTLRALSSAPLALTERLLAQLTIDPLIGTTLDAALIENPPMSLQEGGIIRQGYHTELDTLRELKQTGRSWMARFEAAEKERTGIGSLKVRYNGVLGFFIEVTRSNVSKVPENYMRRQSTANAERFTTAELKEREEAVLSAEGKQILLERVLFEKIRASAACAVTNIRSLATALSELDVLISFAVVAEREDYMRPMVDASLTLNITAGRHPVLARLLGERFIANSLRLEGEGKSCFVITGPNMGGKSTFLRQAALITIMAQIGACVPARSAQIGVVDRIFARLGASDNMLEGESTFMVEMREAAHIVRNATPRSLLLIDEIGRGTATLDGLAVAQAILEWVVLETKSRTLFATHFHELTALEGRYPNSGNLSVGSVDRGEDVYFTHEICNGAARKSYGLEVAKLAGLPLAILQRAKELLIEGAEEERVRAMRGRGRKSTGAENRPQLSLFSASLPVKEPADYCTLTELAASIRKFDTNSTTPLQALTLLAQLKEALAKLS